MSKQPIVFPPTGFEMIDQVLSAPPVAPVQVAGTKSPEQQFGLVEPGGVCRRLQQSYPRGVSPIGVNLRIDLSRDTTVAMEA